MFDLDTDDARRVLTRAHRHSAELRHDAVGVEHLLIALVEYGRGTVEGAFFVLGVSPGEAWKQMELLVAAEPRAGTVELTASLPCTPGAERVLSLSLDEKRQLRHNFLGSEHLLLALLTHLDDPWAEPEPASELIERLGVEPRRLREELLSRIPTDNDTYLPSTENTGSIRGLGPMPQMPLWTE